MYGVRATNLLRPNSNSARVMLSSTSLVNSIAIFKDLWERLLIHSLIKRQDFRQIKLEQECSHGHVYSLSHVLFSRKILCHCAPVSVFYFSEAIFTSSSPYLCLKVKRRWLIVNIDSHYFTLCFDLFSLTVDIE